MPGIVDDDGDDGDEEEDDDEDGDGHYVFKLKRLTTAGSRNRPQLTFMTGRAASCNDAP